MEALSEFSKEKNVAAYLVQNPIALRSVKKSTLFSFDLDEADPKTLKRRIETILTKATAEQFNRATCVFTATTGPALILYSTLHVPVKKR